MHNYMYSYIANMHIATQYKAKKYVYLYTAMPSYMHID